MAHRHPDEGDPGNECHDLPKAQQFRCHVGLIVVHRQHEIEGPVPRLEEDDIRRDWADRLNTFAARDLNGGDGAVDLLATERPPSPHGD